jgi:THO complex subunit 3
MDELMSYRAIKKGEVPIRKVSFSHDAKFLGAIYEGTNLDIYDVNSGECMHSIFTDSQQYCLAWNPKNYVLAYCGDDKNRNNVDEGNIHIIST